MFTITNPEVPQRNDILRNINRVQNQNRPLNHSTLQELSIQPPCTMKLNFINLTKRLKMRIDSLFLYYERPGKALCFSNVARMIMCGCAFKMVPSMFFQMYTLHEIVQGYTFPLVYSLSTRRTEVLYWCSCNRIKFEF